MQREQVARAGLAEGLRARRAEIEAAVLARIQAISGSSGRQREPEYAHGLRATVAAAVDYGLRAIELGEDRCPPIPPVLLTQARLAAHADVDLHTVLRRYVAGYTLLGDYMVKELEAHAALQGPMMQRLLRAQAVLLERLLVAVSEEYVREKEKRSTSTEARRVERVRRLLAGELVDASDLGYDFHGWHLALIAEGSEAAQALSAAAATLDCNPLLVRREEGTAWAWFGARRALDEPSLASLSSREWPERVTVAIGEPGRGYSGWRRTHEQARAALPVALRWERRCTRYRDVALLASMMRDDLLVSSLRELYLAPVETEGSVGRTARETLRAYFGTGRQVSSAAAALGVDRHTVSNRLRAIEHRLGQSLDRCSWELEAALRLDSLAEPEGANGLPRHFGQTRDNTVGNPDGCRENQQHKEE